MVLKLMSLKLAGLMLAAITGVMLRWFLHERMPNTSFSYGLLLANILGSFVLGGVYALYMRSSMSSLAYFILSIGLLGALTSFSSVSLEAVKLLNSGQIVTMLTLLSLHNVLGVLFCYLGFKLI